MATPYETAKAQGYSDSEIARFLAGDKYDAARKAGYSDREIIDYRSSQAAPKTEAAAAPRGPLDITNPQSPLGAAAYWIAQHTPEWIKYPTAEGAAWLNRRLSATSAAALEPFAPAAQALDQALKEKYARDTGTPPPAPLAPLPRMESVPSQAAKLFNAAVNGQSPLPGVPAELAMDALLRRTAGEYHALTPEQADKISRAALGLPVGEIARAATGTEGLSLAAQLPAMNAMNEIGAGLFPVVKAATGRIPGVATRRAVGEIKTNAIRSQIAQEQEQVLALNPLRDATKAVAKREGVPFEAVDERIRTARMREPQDGGAALSALSPEEQAIAQGYKEFDAAQVAEHQAAGLRPDVRNAHIEARRQIALAKIDAANASGKGADIFKAKRAVKRFEAATKASGIAVPRTLAGKIDFAGAKQVLEQAPQMLAGDAAARFTPEAVQEIRAAKGLAPADVSGLGPQSFGVRRAPRVIGNRAITAEEKAGNFLNAHPDFEGPVLKTMFESTAQRGRERALSRASAQILGDLDQRFGKPIVGGKVPEGHVKLSQLRLAKDAFASDRLKYLESRAVPANVFRQAQTITETLGKSSLGDARNFVSKATRAWKGYVLLRTGYPARNITDNMITVWMAGGKSEAAVPAAKALLVAAGKGNPDEYIPALNMTLGDYVKSARRNGTLSGGFVSSELPKVAAPHNILAKGYSAFHQGNAVAENYARTMLDMSRRMAGESASESGQTVDDMLGKYNPRFLSPLERKVTAYGLPWYNWIKQIFRRTGRLALERPGSIAQVAAFPTAVNMAQGMTPDQVKALGPNVRQRGAIVRSYGLPDNIREVFPTSVYGPTDVGTMIGTADKGLASLLLNPAQQTYPPVQWLAAAAGIDLFRGKQFTGEQVDLPDAARVIPKPFWPKLGIKPVGFRLQGPDRLAYFLRQSGPAAMVLGDGTSQDPQAQRRARSFWTGFSSYLADLKESKDINEGVKLKAMKEQIDTARRSIFNEQRSIQHQGQGR